MTRTSAHPVAWCLIFLGLLIIAPALSLGFGPAAIPFSEAFHIFWGKLSGLGDLSQYHSNVVSIIWQHRVPRILSAIGVGAILGISGVVMQAVIRNPLAEPYVLGLSSGASTGAAIAIVIFGSVAAAVISGMAFVGAIAATAVVLWLGIGRGSSSLKLVLAGVAMGFMFSALTNLLIIKANNAETAQSVIFWTLGSLSRPSLNQALTLCVVGLVLGLSMWVCGPYLDALASGDHTCIAIGINPTITRVFVLIPVSAAVAIAVAQTGGIGFIGLVVPHLVRPLSGYAHRGVIALTAVVSSLLLLTTDTVARTVLAPVDIPIGVITALLGAPLLIVLTRRLSS
ncbi:iron chelate uptake ABC transporter family permease subunit [Corynebacterium sp. 3HC-13]|uniref:FecCD family ABC transporter permease n=1 Tax=Corynebacterium poyangense TaxID=2684405 RepID=UPI001CC9E52D|nr:iron ABC transporter permease [Corynebacterium poyangense]MBZ8177684.1 iron chelate uptake ABC transporter family permease subunit [Corynebacterium poyangense]